MLHVSAVRPSMRSLSCPGGPKYSSLPWPPLEKVWFWTTLSQKKLAPIRSAGFPVRAKRSAEPMSLGTAVFPCLPARMSWWRWSGSMNARCSNLYERSSQRSSPVSA